MVLPTMPVRMRARLYPRTPPTAPPTIPRRAISADTAATTSLRVAPRLRRIPTFFLLLMTLNMEVL